MCAPTHPAPLRLTATLLTAALAAAACTAAPAPRPAAGLAGAVRVVDLTHAFGEDTVYWPTDTEGFVLEEVFAGETEAGYHYEAYRFRSAEHGGTHLDAPVHFAAGAWAADEIPVERLVGPGAVVDVRQAAAADRDYLVSVDDLRRWEAEHGRLPDGAILLLHTGTGAAWPDRAAVLGTERTGPEAVPHLHFPGLDPAAARWLVEERAIDAVGIDTPSIDRGQSKLFESHRALFAANVPALENVAHLDRLPAAGFTVVALPMKIRGGSGGPLRVVALLPAE
jgi:kynurenine formamidase